jgi:hypothetical protein
MAAANICLEGPCLLVGFGNVDAACEALLQCGVVVDPDAAVFAAVFAAASGSTRASVNRALRRAPCRAWPARACSWPQTLAYSPQQTFQNT